jgi:hypothetical protein
MVTHYIAAFTSFDGLRQMAVCGLPVLAAQHSAEPTCYRCQEWFKAIEREPAVKPAEVAERY